MASPSETRRVLRSHPCVALSSRYPGKAIKAYMISIGWTRVVNSFVLDMGSTVLSQFTVALLFDGYHRRLSLSNAFSAVSKQGMRTPRVRITKQDHRKGDPVSLWSIGESNPWPATNMVATPHCGARFLFVAAGTDETSATGGRQFRPLSNASHCLRSGVRLPGAEQIKNRNHR